MIRIFLFAILLPLTLFGQQTKHNADSVVARVVHIAETDSSRVAFMKISRTQRDGSSKNTVGVLNYSGTRASLVLYDSIESITPLVRIFVQHDTTTIYYERDTSAHLYIMKGRRETDFVTSEMFTFFKSGFDAVCGGSCENDSVMEINLYPESEDITYNAAKIIVDLRTNRVKELFFYFKNGVVDRVQFEYISINAPISDSLLSFDATKYPGVKIVDHRNKRSNKK